MFLNAAVIVIPFATFSVFTIFIEKTVKHEERRKWDQEMTRTRFELGLLAKVSSKRSRSGY